jgi:hypothetical protein
LVFFGIQNASIELLLKIQECFKIQVFPNRFLDSFLIKSFTKIPKVKMSLRFWVKSVFWSTVIIGGGMLFVKSTVPDQETFKRTLKENGRSVDSTDDEQKKLQKMLNMIKENAQSENPSWDVKW